MRILHLVDRLSDRGGAYRHLLSLISSQRGRHEVALWAGSVSSDVAPPCSTTEVEGLKAREREPTMLPPFEHDEVHLHNVVNPDVLESVAKLEDARKRITVQDHRFFCPGQGKLTADGRVCTDAMARPVCRGCFTDEGYFEGIFALTRARLEALEGFEIEVLSDYMKRELAAVGVPAARISVTPPRPVFAATAPASDSRHPSRVLFVGRLVAAKGVRDAVEAWKRSGVELPLVFAGTGPLRGELERQGFEVLGWVAHERMPALYRSAAAVLLPSRWQEPFGLAGLEAQSLGTPVIAWESGGVPEWHEGARVAWGDVDALATRLRGAVLERRPRS